MVANPILLYHVTHQKKFQASRLLVGGAPSTPSHKPKIDENVENSKNSQNRTEKNHVYGFILHTWYWKTELLAHVPADLSMQETGYTVAWFENSKSVPTIHRRMDSVEIHKCFPRNTFCIRVIVLC